MLPPKKFPVTKDSCAAPERRIAELGLAGRVVLHGHVEGAREKLAGFDLDVSSSHLEGLGTSILDAMLAGLPVVAAAAGGVADVVLDGQTGRLVAPRAWPSASASAPWPPARWPSTASSCPPQSFETQRTRRKNAEERRGDSKNS
jgi:glycosyltransferase involved in cell wall biosynthesis